MKNELDNVRPLSPVSPSTKRMRLLICGDSVAVDASLPPPPLQAPLAMDLDLRGFGASAPLPPLPPLLPQPMPPPVPHGLPPEFTPCALPPLPPRSPSPQAAPTAPPIPPPLPPQKGVLWKHPGILSEFGGLKRWLAMKRGEIPFPEPEEA